MPRSRFLLPCLLLLVSIALAPATLGQASQPSIIFVTSNPSGACSGTSPLRYNYITGDLSACDNGTWAVIATSGGGTPGGSNGQIQYNNSGAFGGLTAADGLEVAGGELQVNRALVPFKGNCDGASTPATPTAGYLKGDFCVNTTPADDTFNLCVVDNSTACTTWIALSAAATGAPADGPYVTFTAEADLSNEFNLGGLTTGLLKHTVAAGSSTPATAVAGTDYVGGQASCPTAGEVPFIDASAGILQCDAELAYSSANRLLTSTKASLGTATSGGFQAINTTDAAAGAQQVSPAMFWCGEGWKTNATAASQNVCFQAYVLPVQGSSAPTGNFLIASSIDGGAYATRLTLNSGGTLSTSVGSFTIASANAYQTGSNCADSAGDAACGSAAAGSVVVDAADTDTVVSTTAVTANSQIFLQYDASLGTRLSVTCNTTPVMPQVTARSASTSFTITLADAPVTNPACFSYKIIN